MKCSILELTKADLDQLPLEEATFLTVILHLANEINILQKAAIASKPGQRLPDPLVDSAQNSQALFFLKILAGKLYEAWRTLEDGYFSAKISKKYDSLLPPVSKQALDKIKKYFGDPNNLIKDVRIKYAFHTDLERVKQSLQTLPSSEPLKVLVPDSIGNIFAQFAEGVTNWSILNAIHADDLQGAIKKLMNEALVAIPGQFLHFAHGFAQTALSQCSFTQTDYAINGATKISEANLPYFAEQD